LGNVKGGVKGVCYYLLAGIHSISGQNALQRPETRDACWRALQMQRCTMICLFSAGQKINSAHENSSGKIHPIGATVAAWQARLASSPKLAQARPSSPKLHQASQPARQQTRRLAA